MAGYIGLMVAERIGERGGVEELLRLLHRVGKRSKRGRSAKEPSRSGLPRRAAFSSASRTS